MTRWLRRPKPPVQPKPIPMTLGEWATKHNTTIRYEAR